MNAAATIPGLYFEKVPPAAEASPLRSDVAAFIGRTRRGPVGQAVRVEQWKGYLQEFGGLLEDSSTTYAIHGYFENGGEVAYVVRVCAPGFQVASTTWNVGAVNDKGIWNADAPAAMRYTRYRIEATSPGQWANETRILIRYRLQGPFARPHDSSEFFAESDPLAKAEVDITVQAPGEPIETFVGLSPLELEKQIEDRSKLIRLIPVDGTSARGAPSIPGRHQDEWDVKLADGHDCAQKDDAPGMAEYLSAARLLGEDDVVEAASAPSLEVALLAVPGLHDDVEDPDERKATILGLIQQAEERHDRLVLVDIPPDLRGPADSRQDANEVVDWVTDLRNAGDATMMRAAAVYHPQLRIPDPLGGIIAPLRTVPCSGHVAGMISWLDRQRGAHHTPANATLEEAVDVTQAFNKAEQSRFNDEGINLVRCYPGRGLVVWGGRTLDLEATGRFISHRRLVHRLVRAMRRVAEPMVFDTNGPVLWLTIVRALTTVLLEAWRAGALKGEKPDEAFRVQCDETTTTPEVQDLGQVVCIVEFAPAVPMEFIVLRVAVSTDGVLEVMEA